MSIAQACCVLSTWNFRAGIGCSHFGVCSLFKVFVVLSTFLGSVFLNYCICMRVCAVKMQVQMKTSNIQSSTFVTGDGLI